MKNGLKSIFGDSSGAVLVAAGIAVIGVVAAITLGSGRGGLDDTRDATAPEAAVTSAGDNTGNDAGDQAASVGTAPETPPATEPGTAAPETDTDTPADTPADTHADTQAAPDTMATPTPELPPAPTPPSFDLVRVDAQGDTVIAGQADALATITLALDGSPIEVTRADSGGNFVAMLALDPSDRPRLLSLEAALGDGTSVLGLETVIIAPFGMTEPEADVAGTAMPDVETAEGAGPALQGGDLVALPEAPGVAVETQAQPENEAQPETPAASGPEIAEAPAPSPAPPPAPSPAPAESAPAQAAEITPRTAPETADAVSDADTGVSQTADATTTATPTDATAPPAADPVPAATPETATGATETATAATPSPEPAQTEPAQTEPASMEPAPATEPSRLAEVTPVTPVTPVEPGAATPPATPQTSPASIAEIAPAPQPAPPVVDAPTVLLADAEGVRVIQGPADQPSAQLDVALDAISYDTEGAVILSGRGPAEAGLRVTLNNQPIQLGEVDASGQWRLNLPDVDPGTYTLRVEQIAADGSAEVDVETPFLREDPARIAANPMLAEPGASVITVQPGFTLWGIAQANFGEGIYYVQIFEQNRGAIRDPDLIFPGQIFGLPDLPRRGD